MQDDANGARRPASWSGPAADAAISRGLSTYQAERAPAAEALAKLAHANMGTQTAIAKAGGVPPLLAMLGSKSTNAQAQAATALAEVGRHHFENQQSITRAGGIVRLMGLLSNNVETSVQAAAAFALTEVCRQNPGSQAQAAAACANQSTHV